MLGIDTQQVDEPILQEYTDEELDGMNNLEQQIDDLVDWFYIKYNCYPDISSYILRSKKK